jgi:hypothetical protein
MRRGTQHPAYSVNERPSACGERQPAAAAKHLEIREGPCVDDGIAAEADGEIVAAVLALVSNAPRQPPHRRVIKEQRFDEGLQQVHEVVVAADVRELVRDDGFDLGGCQRDKRAGGNQHDWFHPAHDGRHVHERRLEQCDPASDM